MKILNLLIIGDCNVGKTSVILKYINTQNITTETTIGLDIFRYHHKLYESIIYFYDISGHPRFSHIIQKYVESIDGIIIVYDITNRESFDNIQFWINHVNNIFDTSIIPIMILGNKNDQDNMRSIGYNDACNFVSKLNCFYKETTVFDLSNIQKIIDNYVSKILYDVNDINDINDDNLNDNKNNNNILDQYKLKNKNKKCVIF